MTTEWHRVQSWCHQWTSFRESICSQNGAVYQERGGELHVLLPDGIPFAARVASLGQEGNEGMNVEALTKSPQQTITPHLESSEAGMAAKKSKKKKKKRNKKR